MGGPPQKERSRRNPARKQRARNTTEAVDLILPRLREFVNLTNAILDRLGAGRQKDSKGILLVGEASEWTLTKLDLIGIETLIAAAILCTESRMNVSAEMRAALGAIVEDDKPRTVSGYVHRIASYLIRLTEEDVAELAEREAEETAEAPKTPGTE